MSSRDIEMLRTVGTMANNALELYEGRSIPLIDLGIDVVGGAIVLVRHYKEVASCTSEILPISSATSADTLELCER